MGAKLENVKKKVEQASRMEKDGLDDGEKDAQEIKEIKSILEGMDKDVDDDIVESMDMTREAAKGEGIEDMEKEVHSKLEAGYEVADDAIDEGTDQAARSRQAAKDFASVAGVSEFGRQTAEESEKSAEKMGGQFEKNANEAKTEMEKTEERFKQLEEEILG